MSQALSSEALCNALKDLPAWSGDVHGISRSFTFADFPQCIAFMVSMVADIEAANHHPEWSNVYNRLTVTLKTHDADNQVTNKDIQLALLLDKRAAA